MAIDFDKWNEQFGGKKALEDLKKAKEEAEERREVPDGVYSCKLEKLELAESKSGKPMIKGQFRIIKGDYKKNCLFVNQVIAGGYPLHMGLTFLRSLNVFDDSEIDFNGDFEEFSELLMDIIEEAQGSNMIFSVKKSMDGDYTRLEVLED